MAAAEGMPVPSYAPGPVFHWPDFTLRVAILEHHGCCLGFAVEEPLHINVWRNRLEARGLTPGAWLQPLKRAIASGAAADTQIELPTGASAPLRDLDDLVSRERGQKIAYVTDIADTTANRKAILELAEGADSLFIEASFVADDWQQAAARAHLTTKAAGEIARRRMSGKSNPFTSLRAMKVRGSGWSAKSKRPSAGKTPHKKSWHNDPARPGVRQHARFFPRRL